MTTTTARMLDGVAVAAQIKTELRDRVDAFSRAQGQAAGPRNRPGRRRFGVGDLRPQQAEVGRGVGPSRRRLPAARLSVDRRGPRRGGGPERERRSRRNPRAVAAARTARSRGRADDLRRRRSGEGRRRVPSRERRTPGAEAPVPRLLHATRCHGTPRPVRHPGGRRSRGRHRPQRHRREAGCDTADAPERDGHGLSFADRGSAAGLRVGRHPGGGDRSPGVRHAGVREGRRHGDRRGHQPSHRCGARRRAVRGGQPAAGRFPAARVVWWSATSIRPWRAWPAP